MNFEYISARGDRLPLATNNLFHLVNVDGQTAASSSIASMAISGADGVVVNNVQADPRSIVITLRMKNDADVEEAKRAVLKVVKLKQRGTLEWSQNYRTVVISGVVESIEMPRWNNAVAMQITMYCEQPFWEDIDFVIRQINETLDLHYFTDSAGDMLYFPEEGIPFGAYDTIRTKHFYNDGDVAVGIEIKILALADVTNPIIYHNDGSFFGVGYDNGAKKVTMKQGDEMVIVTHKGKKSVTLNGKNLISKVRPQSTWLQIATGDNAFSINSEDDSLSNMSFTLIYKRRFV